MRRALGAILRRAWERPPPDHSRSQQADQKKNQPAEETGRDERQLDSRRCPGGTRTKASFVAGSISSASKAASPAFDVSLVQEHTIGVPRQQTRT